MVQPQPPTNPINLTQKASLIDQHWSPRVVAEMNDYQFKVVRIEGEFIWHSHPETDEALWCWRARYVSTSQTARSM